MLKFIKYVFATIVGVFLFFVISFILILIVVSIAMPDRDKMLADRAVMKIVLNKNISERETDDFFSQFASPFSRRESGTIGLLELRQSIKKAKVNNNIKGILLDIRRFNAGFASLEELRSELVDFKESGKFVYAYSESYSEGGYYLASVADRIFLPPTGDLEFNGFDLELTFFKGTLDKLDIQPEIFRVGEYKSAIESITSKQMSRENREQLEVLLSTINQNYLSNVATSRKLEVEQLQNIADSLLVRQASDALKYGLITDVAYYSSLDSLLKEKTGKDFSSEMKFASYRDLHDIFEQSGNSRKVAVVVAEGNIESGRGKTNTIGSETFVEEIRKARLNDDIKAVVIRVNSPGGSALASDVIWNEIVQTRKVKPVIASMSDMAASGGYYIAAACDTIVAHNTTLTGSIGVFGVLFNGKEFLENKFGITTDRVKTSPFSDIGSFTREMTNRERQIIQGEVERTYDIFLKVVTDGRKLDRDYVHSLAQGRVWSGEDAKERKLVDISGNLEDAINIAAAKAGIEDDYSVTYLPELKDAVLRQLMAMFFSDRDDDLSEEKLGILSPYIRYLLELKDMEGVQARLPYKVNVY